MPQWCKSAFDALRKPEWIAAVALLIQAVILFLQYKILGRHAKTMEQHTETAGTQAKTAESIGKALEQQGKVLGEQTKIMDEQFKFQRRLEEKAERTRLFESLTDLGLLVTDLQFVLGSISSVNEAVRDRVNTLWGQLFQQIVRCTKELGASIHITKEEKDYFLKYLRNVNELYRLRRNNFQEDFARVKAFQSEHEDFTQRLSEAARTPL